MKRVEKVFVLSVVLLLSVAFGKAQSSATAHVSVNITYPVSISFEEQDTYAQVVAYNRLQGKNSRYELTVASFSVLAPATELYNISIPQTLNLHNNQDGDCITALVNQHALQIPQWLSNERKQFTVDSQLKLTGNHVKGKYDSAPFEVTVNFD